MRVWMLLFLTTLSTACTAPRVVTQTEVVTETVTVYRDIPAHLTALVPLGKRPEGEVLFRDLFGLLADERANVGICNGRLAAIASLSGESTDE